MKSYSLNEATRKLGISRARLLEMIKQKEIKFEKAKNGGYLIYTSEIKRLAKKLEKEEEDLDRELAEQGVNDTPKNVEEKYYTVTQVSELLGVERSEIMRLVKTGKIESTKGEAQRSPYLIPEGQLQELCSKNRSEKNNDNVKQKVVSALGMEPKGQNYSSVLSEKTCCDEIAEIQKNISKTQHQIALTQQQMAETIAELLKKL